MANRKKRKKICDDFAIQQYVTLRNEVLKRLEIRDQLILYTLIIAGTFLTIGSQNGIKPRVLLLYPILAVLLAGNWSQNNLRIRQIGYYIKEHIEKKMKCNGWDTYFASGEVKRTQTTLFTRGIFIITQCASIGLALPKLSFDFEEFLLLFFDLLSLTGTFFIIKKLPADKL